MKIERERPPPRNEPHVEPVNGIVQPPVVPPASRPGRITNQLQYLKNVVLKGKIFLHNFGKIRGIYLVLAELPVSSNTLIFVVLKVSTIDQLDLTQIGQFLRPFFDLVTFDMRHPPETQECRELAITIMTKRMQG